MIKNTLHKAKNIYIRHKKYILIIIAVVVATPVLLVILCHAIINRDSRYILGSGDSRHVRVGLVLGAGITKSGKPFKELQARLDVAAKAINDGQVDKLILSGDNRFKDYDEPTAMKNYLVSVKHISVRKLQLDLAGRSTYESCERASKVFGLHNTIIFSARTHLPRAIYLCRHFGIEAYGISSNVEANNGSRRELPAGVKAIFNVYIYGEKTVLGKAIKV